MSRMTCHASRTFLILAQLAAKSHVPAGKCLPTGHGRRKLALRRRKTRPDHAGAGFHAEKSGRSTSLRSRPPIRTRAFPEGSTDAHSGNFNWLWYIT